MINHQLRMIDHGLILAISWPYHGHIMALSWSYHGLIVVALMKPRKIHRAQRPQEGALYAHSREPLMGDPMVSPGVGSSGPYELDQPADMVMTVGQ